MKRKRLGEVLQERGKISQSDLSQLIQEQQGKVMRLGELILKRGLIERGDLAMALEEVTRVRYVNRRPTLPRPPPAERERQASGRYGRTAKPECD